MGAWLTHSMRNGLSGPDEHRRRDPRHRRNRITGLQGVALDSRAFPEETAAPGDPVSR